MRQKAPASLHRLIYVSQASAAFDEATLIGYGNQFALANAAVNLSGVLIHIGGRFMQVLEGDLATIEPLMERICRDPRHSGVRIVSTEAMTRRLFAEWNMALLDFHSPEAHQRFDTGAIASLSQLIENIARRTNPGPEALQLIGTVPRLMKVYRLPRGRKPETDGRLAGRVPG